MQILEDAAITCYIPFIIANIVIEEGLHMIIEPDEEVLEKFREQLRKNCGDDLVELIAKAINKYF